ncbi:ras-related protein Rab-24-like [Dendronephthya gigantea]|uniref:ras-related protein Rab-24-like n=1 Tax=Dendronephthya gigantea TaxID=151771 RepID=UPI001068DEE5|nr:ras-related protein Rab-24-like [Dendronephthya gigantea]
MSEKVYLKVVLLGKVNSGKTCLVTRYITDTFSPEQPSTIGAAFCRKDINVEGQLISLAIWDTAGAERYQAMSSMYYRNAKAAIICFDLSEISSFEKADYWVKQILENEPKCKIYICGTKLDLIEDEIKTRAVSKDSVEGYARGRSAEVFETSSKTGTNIGELFQRISYIFLSNSDLLPSKQGTKGRLTLSSSDRPTKSSCC